MPAIFIFIIGQQLFVSSLSIAQFVSVFQKKKTNDEIKKFVRNILTKFTVINFGSQDIENSLNLEGTDMEDNIQYVISSKLNCFYFVTNNKKDYNRFFNIRVLSPKEIRVITQ